MCRHFAGRCNSDFGPPGQLPHPRVGRSPKVCSAGGRFGLNPSLLFNLGATDGTTSPIPSASGHNLPDSNIEESKPGNPSGYVVDPTATDENKPNWKSTVYASAGVAIGALKESSDAFTPLKSVIGGLSAVLKYYDV